MGGIKMVFDKIKEIIADKLKIDRDEIKLEKNFQSDFGADSLDAVEIMMAVEDEFDIDIDDEDLVKIKTVKDIVDYIENLNK